MTTFKVGDRVEVITTKYGTDQFGDEGVVVPNDFPLPSFPVKVKFPKPAHALFNVYDHHDLAFIEEPKQKLATKTPPSIAGDLNLKPQSKTILRHLRKKNHISPAEALIVYGISRLAACIYDIRQAGYDVQRDMRQDAQGHRYANYSLPK